MLNSVTSRIFGTRTTTCTSRIRSEPRTWPGGAGFSGTSSGAGWARKSSSRSHVSRIPPRWEKHRNLTLAALLDDPRLSGQLRCELRCELKHIQKLKLVKEVRERRNRVVAHSDERIALGEDALPILQVAKIEKIISRLQDVHRRHRGASMGSDVSHYGTYTLRGVKNLVKRLEQSERG